MIRHSIYDSQIYEASLELAEYLVESHLAQEYKQTKRKLAQDEVAQVAMKRFQQAKWKYEEAARFGRYHPDYAQLRQEMLACKLELDRLPTVAMMKRVEKELEQLLHAISLLLARRVSSTIKVPSDDPILQLQGGAGCGGGCASGGCSSCGNH